jgi:hypothetical protein
LPRWIFSFLQFFPLSLFAAYAFWNGPPDDARWQRAFELAAIAAIIQLAILLPQRRPVNRLVLAGNIYLLLGGLAFLTSQWWFLRYYNSLRETAIFVFMIAVGVVTMFATREGYAALPDAPRSDAMRASLALLIATAVALGLSIAFRGNRLTAAVIPILGLTVLQQLLVRRQAVKSSSRS